MAEMMYFLTTKHTKHSKANVTLINRFMDKISSRLISLLIEQWGDSF